jgi:hypothetical protein
MPAINWLTHTFSCTSGSMGDEGSTDWTHPEYAYDNNDGNLASVVFTGFGVSEYLFGDPINTSGYSGSISRVWFGCKIKSSNLNLSYFMIGTDDITFANPTFGSNLLIGDNIKNSQINTEETFWIECYKYDYSEITWSDIEDLYIILAVSSTGSYTAYCNQLYVKVEYTTQTVTRNTTTIHYNAGSTSSATSPWNDTDWTNSAYAWDDNDGNYATVALTSPNYSYLLRATGHDNVITSGEIKFVGTKVKLKASAAVYYYSVISVSINNGSNWVDYFGSIAGDGILSISTTEDDYGDAITEYYNGSSTPSGYNADDFTSWTIVNNVDLRCAFGWYDTNGTISVNQFELFVVYYTREVSSPFPCHFNS